jgi:putative hydrolase of the HAD superfamily
VIPIKNVENADAIHIVFDFGAVLITWYPVDLVAECFPQQADTLPHAGHLAHAIFGHKDWQAFDRGTLSTEAVIEQTVARLGLDRLGFKSLVEGMGQRLVPMPETVELLQRLSALRAHRKAQGLSPIELYFLSNMPQPYARSLEQSHAFLKEFDGGIFSGDVQHIKPEPEIYQLLQSRHALVPARTVFIDDLSGNVQAARNLGWHGIHFESAQQLVAELNKLGLDCSE